MLGSSQEISLEETMKELWIRDCLNIMALSCLLYDYVITIGAEIQYFWHWPLSKNSLFFFFPRYLALFGNAGITALRSVKASKKSCRGFQRFRQVTLTANELIVTAVLFWRTYALYGRSSRLLIILLVIVVLLLASVCYFSVASHSGPVVQTAWCYDGISQKQGLNYAAAWGALLIFDTLIFALTMAKTWKARFILPERNRRDMPVMSIFFRDGAIYYFVMAISNLANVVTYYLSGPFLKGSLSAFAISLSAIMISRLMFNLRETASELVVHWTTIPMATNRDDPSTIQISQSVEYSDPC